LAEETLPAGISDTIILIEYFDFGFTFSLLELLCIPVVDENKTRACFGSGMMAVNPLQQWVAGAFGRWRGRLDA
jgi:hypothetical protein